MNKMIRVMLVDDHVVVRAGIRQFIEQADDICVVAEAGDGGEAMTLIQEHQPDVAVLDIQMPVKNGIDVTRWVRANYRDIGVLVLTAFDDDPYILAMLQAGANGYVMKTASLGEILQAIRDVHEGKSILDPAITKKVFDYMSGVETKSDFEPLTDREMEVLRQAGRGYTNKAIGVQLGISDRTVQGHLANIYDKLGVHNRTEAVMQAVSLGLLEDGLAN